MKRDLLSMAFFLLALIFGAAYVPWVGVLESFSPVAPRVRAAVPATHYSIIMPDAALGAALQRAARMSWQMRRNESKVTMRADAAWLQDAMPPPPERIAYVSDSAEMPFPEVPPFYLAFAEPIPARVAVCARPNPAMSRPRDVALLTLENFETTREKP